MKKGNMWTINTVENVWGVDFRIFHSFSNGIAYTMAVDGQTDFWSSETFALFHFFLLKLLPSSNDTVNVYGMGIW